MSDLKSMKKVLRSDITKIRTSMTEANRCTQSNDILSKLLENGKFRDSQRVSVFIGMPEEIKTGNIIESIFRLGKRCFIPRIILKSKHMDMVEMRSLEEIETLPTIKWGIRQPETVTREAMGEGGLDFMIVPGVAFGPDNSRLGHGAGYYDHYFARYKDKFNELPYLVGVCYKEQINSSIPMGPYDVYMNEVISG